MDILNHKDRQGDEIDLHEIWNTIVKRKKLILGLFIFSIILTFVISLFMPKVYVGKIILQIGSVYSERKNTTRANEFENILRNLDIKKSLLKEINKSISKIDINTLKNSEDKVMIIIETKDPEAFPNITSELIEYFESNILFKRPFENEREVLLKKLEGIQKALESAKEYKKYYMALLREGKIGIVGFNPIDLDTKISDLEAEKLRLKQALSQLKRFEIIGQNISDKPVKPKIFLNLAIAGFTSILVGIFLALFLENLKKDK